MPPPPATPAPRAASCFAKEAVRQGRPEPPPPPFQPHPSLRLRQTKGGVLRSHQPSRTQEFLIGGKGREEGVPQNFGRRKLRSQHGRAPVRWDDIGSVKPLHRPRRRGRAGIATRCSETIFSGVERLRH